MKKIISFDKNLDFKSMIGEISSISLDHDLKFTDGSNINGEFIVSGSYRLTEASRLEDEFDFKIPVEIILNEVLDLSDAKIEIEDFVYHIENDDTLVCHIEVLVEGVEEVRIEEEDEEAEIIDEKQDDKEEEKQEEVAVLKDEDYSLVTDRLNEEKLVSDIDIVGEVLERECDGDMKMDEAKKDDGIKDVEMLENVSIISDNISKDVGSLFSSLGDSDETYSTYSVYIVRENDTIDSIMSRYKVTREELENYNDFSALDVGCKVIIPTADEEINKLFRKLGLKVNTIGYKNGEKVVCCDEGKFVIRESLQNEIYDYLDSRGFNNYSGLIGRGNNYDIYKYEEDNVKPNDKAIDLVYLLSLLHIKTTTYREIDLDKVKEFYEKTIDEIEYLNAYYHRLQDYVEGKVYMSPAEYLFIRNASLIYEMLSFSKRYLERWYDTKTKEKRERVVLINNNLTLSNFVEEDKEKFLNWDKARKDWVSYDFYNFYINNYLEIEMKSLYEIYQSKYRYTKDEELLLYTLLCKLWKVDFQGSNYENTLKFSNLVMYLRKTREFLKDNKENQETYKEEFQEQDNYV